MESHPAHLVQDVLDWHRQRERDPDAARDAAVKEINARVAGALRAGQVRRALILADEALRATGRDDDADRLKVNAGAGEIARRLVAAWTESGWRPRPQDLLLQMPALREAHLHAVGAERATGAWAEMGEIRPRNFSPGPTPRGGLSAWARRMRWALDVPGLAEVPHHGAVCMMIHPHLIGPLADQVRSARIRHSWQLVDERYLMLITGSTPTYETACSAWASCDLQQGQTRYDPRELVSGLPERIAPRTSSHLCNPRGGGATFLAATAQDPCLREFLDELAACEHVRACWRPNHSADALRLWCPDCDQHAIACVPMHRIDPARITDRSRYLHHERFYAALSGAPLPATWDDLHHAPASAVIGDYLPAAWRPAEDLAAALFA